MTPSGDASHRRLPSRNMNGSFRFSGSRLKAAFAWFCLLMGSATAQTPLQDLPITSVTSGGTYSFSGSAAFADFSTGYDSNPVIAGNQTFDAGYQVKSLSGLNTLTTLNLGQAGGSRQRRSADLQIRSGVVRWGASKPV